MTGSVVTQSMSRALELARRGPVGPNPRVGAVVLDDQGQVAGEGWHEGAGTAHAEVVALALAGARAAGGTAVVTLEPCRHTGRTAPCTQALLDAGVGQVVYARPDRTAVAAGGAEVLRAQGVVVELVADPDLRSAAEGLVELWQLAHDLDRPVVTWKLATTLDGRSAAADGSSRWITGPAARADVHDLRSEADVVLVGTGTVLADDPRLTVRDSDGHDRPRQPLRAVMGRRDLPLGRRVDQGSMAVRLRTREPKDALAQLWELDCRHVWLEGGPRLAAAFWRAGLVDRVVAYVAPALLGAGASAVADLGITTVGDAARLILDDVTRVGDDVRLMLRPTTATTLLLTNERDA